VLPHHEVSTALDINLILIHTKHRHIGNFLSSNETRSVLGVDRAVPQKFSSCAHDVGARFNARYDRFHPTYHYVAALLERGIRVLIYVGEYDWICNWVGNRAWTEALEWSGGDAYRKVGTHLHTSDCMIKLKTTLDEG
jgi:carboxypeptidase C (cathepsin A)